MYSDRNQYNLQAFLSLKIWESIFPLFLWKSHCFSGVSVNEVEVNYLWDEPVCISESQKNKCKDFFLKRKCHSCGRYSSLSAAHKLGLWCLYSLCSYFPLEFRKFCNWMVLLTWTGMYFVIGRETFNWASSMKWQFYNVGLILCDLLTRPHLRRKIKVCFKSCFCQSLCAHLHTVPDMLSLFGLTTPWNNKEADNWGKLVICRFLITLQWGVLNCPLAYMKIGQRDKSKVDTEYVDLCSVYYKSCKIES